MKWTPCRRRTRQSGTPNDSTDSTRPVDELATTTAKNAGIGICQLCNARARTTREHVYPKWFLERWPTSTGPFTTHHNGEPLRTRAGKKQQTERLSPILLAICETCHRALNAHYEVPAKTPVRTLLDDGKVLTTQAEVDVVARWMIKTLALCRHPNSRHKGNLFRRNVPGLTNFAPINPWDPFPTKLADEIRAGVAPTEVAMWMARATDVPGVVDPPLPWEGWGTRPPEHQSFTMFSVDGDEFAVFHLAYHPGRSHLDHPFIATGQAVQLWPEPPTSVSLALPAPVPRGTRMHSVWPR